MLTQVRRESLLTDPLDEIGTREHRDLAALKVGFGFCYVPQVMIEMGEHPRDQRLRESIELLVRRALIPELIGPVSPNTHRQQGVQQPVSPTLR